MAQGRIYKMQIGRIYKMQIAGTNPVGVYTSQHRFGLAYKNEQNVLDYIYGKEKDNVIEQARILYQSGYQIGAFSELKQLLLQTQTYDFTKINQVDYIKKHHFEYEILETPIVEPKEKERLEKGFIEQHKTAIVIGGAIILGYFSLKKN